METRQKPDYILLGVVGALIVLGLIILASASFDLGQGNFGESYYYLKHQVFYGVLGGLVLGVLAYKINYKVWKRLALPLFLVGFLLLLLIFLPGLGYSYGGALRWIKIGGISLQPSEIVKLGLILYLAAWFERKEGDVKNLSEGVLPFLFILGLLGITFAFQPNISTFGVIALTSLVIFFLAGGRFIHLGLIVLGGAGFLWTLIKVAPYRLARFSAFFNPQIDPQGISYQINQALLAIGGGGLLGRGLGQSLQKFKYLPEPIGDSIFAIWAEEAGFIGAALLVFLFLILIWRGFTVAKNSPCEFGKLSAGGITCWIGIQAFINIAGIIGLIPLTGTPLPFVSYGGSALIVSMVGMGILLNISKYNKN